MKRTLLALLLALTLLLTCAVTVSAETLNIDGKVTAGESFTIDLGEYFTENSTVWVDINNVGPYGRWSPTVTDSDLFWDHDNKVLTVGGQYVDASNTGSLAGLTL
ncbi:MAG: hypothetical protein ACI4XW_04390, partial [Candidatus Spyradocola sp.]